MRGHLCDLTAKLEPRSAPYQSGGGAWYRGLILPLITSLEVEPNKREGSLSGAPAEGKNR